MHLTTTHTTDHSDGSRTAAAAVAHLLIACKTCLSMLQAVTFRFCCPAGSLVLAVDSDNRMALYTKY